MKENIFDLPEMACLGEEKIAFLKEMTQKSKGKSPIEMMSLFEEYRTQFSQGGGITPQEKKAILMALRESLDESERKKFDYVVQMLF
jgi:hypothetical protein